MNKKIIFIVIALVLAVMFAVALTGGTLFYLYYNGYFAKYIQIFQPDLDVSSMTYTIGGESFKLNEGKAEKEYIPGFAGKNKLSIFGEPVYGDLDADGDKDAALWLVNEPGGSGSFFYAVLAINNGTTSESVTTNTLLLGDRIAPQTLEIHDGRAVYNFAERRADEPMTADPSVGRSFWINYDKATNQISDGSGIGSQI